MADKIKTIVITGASSGIGKATARFFQEKSWNVVAAMRNPSAEKELLESGQAGRARLIKNRSEAGLVAAKIFEAANDRSDRLRYLVGPDAKRLWSLRRWFGYKAQMRVFRNMVKLNNQLHSQLADAKHCR